MALFKILKGKHNKLDAQSKTDGWAWFTPDNGSFYIDALNADETTVDRIQINPKSIVIETEIYGFGSSLWDLDNKIFPIVNEQITENYNGYITINSKDFNLTRQAALANFHIINYEDGSLFIQAKGTLPIDTIPVVITLVPAPTPIYYNIIFSGTHAQHAYITNHSTKIKENESCTLTIQLDTTHSQYYVTILMGDVEIFHLQAFSGGAPIPLNIPNVTDNIEIIVNGSGGAEPV